MAYSDKVIDHYNEPRNVGSFDKNDDAVGTGLVGAPECGDVMKLQIKVEKRSDRRCQIQDLRLRFCNCQFESCHRMGQGKEH